MGKSKTLLQNFLQHINNLCFFYCFTDSFGGSQPFHSCWPSSSMMKPDVSTCVAIPEAGWNRKPTIKQTNIPHYIYIYFFVIWLLHPFLYKNKTSTHTQETNLRQLTQLCCHPPNNLFHTLPFSPKSQY